MTRSEREQLIERYLSGRMSSGQEEDFFIEVAANRELRQELKAYRVVEQAIADESRAISSTHTALRGHVQGMLVATGVSAAGSGSGSGQGSAASEGAVGSSSGSAGGVGSIIQEMALPVKWMVGSLAVATLAVGTILLDPFSNGAETSHAVGDSVERIERTPGNMEGEDRTVEELSPSGAFVNGMEGVEGENDSDDRKVKEGLRAGIGSALLDDVNRIDSSDGSSKRGKEGMAVQKDQEMERRDSTGFGPFIDLRVNPPQEKK